MAILKIQEIKMQAVKIKKYLKGFALVLVCDIAYDNPCHKHHKTKENPLNKKINYIYNMLVSAKLHSVNVIALYIYIYYYL